MRAALILKSCATPFVMRPAVDILSRAERRRSFARRALRSVVARTAWPHFCAGETLDDCVRVANRMKECNVSLIVDHSVEERERPEDWVVNLRRKKELLRRCADTLGSAARFVPVKVTALASPRLLEDISEILSSQDDTWDVERDVEDQLDNANRELLGSALENLRELCEEARSIPNMSLALDAEQSHRQPALDYLANRTMSVANAGDDARTILYNTVQCYALGANRRLRRDVARAEREGYRYGVKLVRGAYLEAERQRSAELGTSFPLHSTKTEVDAAYDRAATALLNDVRTHSGRVSVLIATHNSASVSNAKHAMRELELSNAHPSVHFATIMGMSDHLTIGLGLEGYNALKLVLFGDFDEIYPWLIRRLEENREIFGGAHDEYELIMEELYVRLRGRS